MNPDVTDNIISYMSELQLQFLQHLKIQPLQTHLAAPAYQSVSPAIVTTPHPESAIVENVPAPQPAPQPTPWLAADLSLPLVQDLLCCLQQAGVAAHWYYQAEFSDIELTSTGFYSATPQSFLTPAHKKQLWQRLSQLLPAEVPAEDTAAMDPI